MRLKPIGGLLFCPSAKADGNIYLLFLLQAEYQSIVISFAVNLLHQTITKAILLPLVLPISESPSDWEYLANRFVRWDQSNKPDGILSDNKPMRQQDKPKVKFR